MEPSGQPPSGHTEAYKHTMISRVPFPNCWPPRCPTALRRSRRGRRRQRRDPGRSHGADGSGSQHAIRVDRPAACPCAREDQVAKARVSRVYWPAASWPLLAKAGWRMSPFVPPGDEGDCRIGTPRYDARSCPNIRTSRFTSSIFVPASRTSRSKSAAREPILPPLCRGADRRCERKAGCRASPPRQADRLRARG
jgi:hypothetical protein